MGTHIAWRGCEADVVKSPELLISLYALSRESWQNLTLVGVEMCYFESTSGELDSIMYLTSF